MDKPNPLIIVFQDSVQQPRLRVDAPGERAVSAEIIDPLELIREIAFQAGFETDDSVVGQVTISLPPGS